MRAFFAINLQQKLKDKIYSYAKRFLDNNFKDFRQIKTENIHLTLLFLGNINNDSNLLEARLCNLLSQQSMFKIDLTKFDFFNTRKGKLVWLGVENSENLITVASLIRQEFPDIKKDKREFLPHITVARDAFLKNNIINREGINISLPVKSISLMKSDFTNKGVIYREIFNKPLNKKDI